MPAQVSCVRVPARFWGSAFLGRATPTRPLARRPASARNSRLFCGRASLLIASGADIKTVQARMRHASARTTLDTYRHLWPDADESTRSAIGAAITERLEKTPAVPLRSHSTAGG